MIAIRPAHPADSPGVARVHVDSWRTTYLGIVPDDFLASLSYERRQAMWDEWLRKPHEEAQTYLAETEAGEIVGIATCGLLREALPGFDGELYGLYILQAYQRHGLGRRLVERVAGDLSERGCTSMVAWVLKDNPACGFYERIGGRLLAEKAIEIGGAVLLEVAYGWQDLKELTDPSDWSGWLSPFDQDLP